MKFKAKKRYLLYYLKNNKFLVFLLGFILGIIFKDKYVFDVKFFILNNLLVFSLVSIFFFIKSKNFRFVLIYLFLGISIGIIRYDIYFKINFFQVEKKYNKQVRLSCKVVKETQLHSGKNQFVVKTDKYGKILVTAKRYPEFFLGQILKIEGRLIEPPEFEEFSYKDYLQIERINYLMKDPEIEILQIQKSKFLRFISKIKFEIIKKIEILLPEPHSSLLQGLILGVKAYMPDDFNNKLQITGTTHIIAVSGYNVSLVVIMLMKLKKIISRKYLPYLISVFLFFFILLIGIDNIPALRAVIMGYIYLLAMINGRTSNILNILFIVIFVFIFQNPLIYKSISFQLTIAATFGIITYSKYLERKIKFIPKVFREDLVATIAAILWTSPITIRTFNTLSLISPIVNLVVLPIVPLATNLGILMVFLSFLNQNIAEFFAYFVWIQLEFIIKVIDKFGYLRGLYLKNISMATFVILFIYIFYILFLFYINFKIFINKLSSKK